MPSELVSELSALHDKARALWDDEATSEIKAVFKKHYDAFIKDDGKSLISDGFAQFYARIELGENITPSFTPGAKLAISADGNVDSDGKYEKYDPGWEETALVFFKNLISSKYDDLTLPLTGC